LVALNRRERADTRHPSLATVISTGVQGGFGGSSPAIKLDASQHPLPIPLRCRSGRRRCFPAAHSPCARRRTTNERSRRRKSSSTISCQLLLMLWACNNAKKRLNHSRAWKREAQSFQITVAPACAWAPRSCGARSFRVGVPGRDGEKARAWLRREL